MRSGRRSSTRRGRGRRSSREPEADRDLGPDADPESLARSIVLTRLTAQARTRHELSTSLQQRNVPDEVADAVLDRMEEVGLVDDAAFADSWVASRQGRRHLSRGALRQELVKKGVDREQIDEALEQVGHDDEYRAARELAEKKLRSMRGLERPVKYRRLAGALGRKGFGSHITQDVIRAVLADDRDDQDAGAEFDAASESVNDSDEQALTSL